MIRWALLIIICLTMQRQQARIDRLEQKLLKQEALIADLEIKQYLNLRILR